VAGVMPNYVISNIHTSSFVLFGGGNAPIIEFFCPNSGIC